VILENKTAGSVLGNPAAPWINALAAHGANFAHSYAITHPSEPNYLALFSGSTQGITDNRCPLTFTAPNLAGQLAAARLRFVGYSESLPRSGYRGCSSGEYARKHAPWVNWPALPVTVNQSMSAFPVDYTRLPQVAFVVPNLVSDMHDGSIATGDAWLHAHLDRYLSWARIHNSLLVLTFDEDDRSDGNQIVTVFAGQRVRPGTYRQPIDHYTVLRTMQAAFGLPPIAHSAAVAPITDVWTR
jgi:phosphatidylinositol-3-phosphatase